jgi:hypothetical protein
MNIMNSKVATIFALALMACGSSQSDGAAAGNQDLSGTGSTNPVACGGQAAAPASPAPASLDACQGNAKCVQATVLGILYASNLQLNGIFDPTTNGTDGHARAGEFLAQELQTDGVFGKFSVQTSAGGTPGTTKVTFGIVTVSKVPGNFTVTPEGDCVQCNVFDDGLSTQFVFTISNGAIVEQQVTVQQAG